MEQQQSSLPSGVLKYDAQRKRRRKGSMTEDMQLICSDLGRNSRFQAKMRHFSGNAAIRPPNAARRAVRQRRMNRLVGEDSPGEVNRKAPRSRSGCGKQTTVPFEPRGDRPVYCQDCYSARKRDGGDREDFGTNARPRGHATGDRSTGDRRSLRRGKNNNE